MGIRFTLEGNWEFIKYAIRAIMGGWKIRGIKRTVITEYKFEIYRKEWK